MKKRNSKFVCNHTCVLSRVCTHACVLTRYFTFACLGAVAACFYILLYDFLAALPF